MSAMPGEASDSPDTPVDLATVKATVEEHFPALWDSVKAGLSTCATLLLKDISNCTALIYVGLASAGKTTVAEMFTDDAITITKRLCYVSV